MKHLLMLAGVYCLCYAPLHAQSPCGTPTPVHPLTLSDARVSQQLQQFHSPNTGVKTLPVVVHVLHSLNWPENIGTGSNLPHQVIANVINGANIYLRKQNADTTAIPAPFRNLAADCEVELCLAQQDPAGYAMYEPGIDRIDCQAAGITMSDFINLNQFQQNFAPQLAWDLSRYMNVWVLPVGAMIYGQYAGYGTFPDSSGLPGLQVVNYNGAGDGIFISYIEFFNQNTKLVAHETGHFLGLRHIWGDASCGDDYCADTPTQAGPNSGCPNFPSITCSNGPNGDMFTNYMDYSSPNCQHQFTYDQKARMQTVLLNSPHRRELPSSNACSPGIPLPPQAAYNFHPSLLCPGGSVVFTDFSGYSPLTWSWSFPGGTPASSSLQNPVVTYNNAGIYPVTLIVANAQGSDTLTIANAVTVAGAGPYPAFADFENGVLPPSDFEFVPYLNSAAPWQLANVSAYGAGQHSMMAHIWNTQPIRSYRLDLSQSTSPELTFDYASARDSTSFSSIQSSVAVIVSTDCAQNFSSVPLMIPDSLLQTSPPTVNFVPTPAQWRTATANLAPYAGQPEVFVEIIGQVVDWIYLDNINIHEQGPLAVQEHPQNFVAGIFPNPSSDGTVNLQLSGTNGEPMEVMLHDLAGRELGVAAITGDGMHVLDFGTLSAGMYVITVKNADGCSMQLHWIVGD